MPQPAPPVIVLEVKTFIAPAPEMSMPLVAPVTLATNREPGPEPTFTAPVPAPFTAWMPSPTVPVTVLAALVSTMLVTPDPVCAVNTPTASLIGALITTWITPAPVSDAEMPLPLVPVTKALLVTVTAPPAPVATTPFTAPVTVPLVVMVIGPAPVVTASMPSAVVPTTAPTPVVITVGPAASVVEMPVV